ncbi:hypothetical protein [Mesobacterium pallidum]|uniref:hypothetical protein n=1 Tax=Mesobacterium pallidum TaxID=2872037 RepID=UPI001EE32610|nr:hypothetical protein [Mesobacterium pallidum]
MIGDARLVEIVEVLAGRRGSLLDRAVTVRELTDYDRIISGIRSAASSAAASAAATASLVASKGGATMSIDAQEADDGATVAALTDLGDTTFSSVWIIGCAAEIRSPDAGPSGTTSLKLEYRALDAFGWGDWETLWQSDATGSGAWQDASHIGHIMRNAASIDARLTCELDPGNAAASRDNLRRWGLTAFPVRA